jgi:hypothetical protein
MARSSTKISCYPNTTFAGNPSISRTLTTGTVNIVGATQIGCMIYAYIIPTQDSTITLTINTDGAHNNKQIDGFYYCPPSTYRCNLMNSENKDEMTSIPITALLHLGLVIRLAVLPVSRMLLF